MQPALGGGDGDLLREVAVDGCVEGIVTAAGLVKTSSRTMRSPSRKCDWPSLTSRRTVAGEESGCWEMQAAGASARQRKAAMGLSRAVMLVTFTPTMAARQMVYLGSELGKHIAPAAPCACARQAEVAKLADALA